MSPFEIIDSYCACYPHEKDELVRNTAFLKECADPYARSSVRGHITASAIVYQHKKLLLIKHRYIHEWFQPGGHIDPGETPPTAAIRELEEETGWIATLDNLNALPLDIDVHAIPANAKKQEEAHIHVDFAYLLNPQKQVTPTDPEMADWFDVDAITAPRLVRIIQKLRGN